MGSLLLFLALVVACKVVIAGPLTQLFGGGSSAGGGGGWVEGDPEALRQWRALCDQVGECRSIPWTRENTRIAYLAGVRQERAKPWSEHSSNPKVRPELAAACQRLLDDCSDAQWAKLDPHEKATWIRQQTEAVDEQQHLARMLVVQGYGNEDSGYHGKTWNELARTRLPITRSI